MIYKVAAVFSIHALLCVVDIHGLGMYESFYLGTCRVAQNDKRHIYLNLKGIKKLQERI